VPLIEDAAQSFGARVRGTRVGTFGDAGVYSFGMYKNVTAFYGGMVVTPRAAIDKAMRAELAGKPYMPMSMLMPKVLKAMFTDAVTAPPLFKSLIYWVFRFGYLHNVRAINKHVITELDTRRASLLR
jgi:dTDP-4-amino-4,6-dideoxygalactose transaminase